MTRLASPSLVSRQTETPGWPGRLQRVVRWHEGAETGRAGAAVAEGFHFSSRESSPIAHCKPAAPDRLLYPAQFSQPGHADPRYSLHTCDGVGNIGVAGPLGRDARPVQAGRMRPALDIRFSG